MLEEKLKRKINAESQLKMIALILQRAIHDPQVLLFMILSRFHFALESTRVARCNNNVIRYVKKFGYI